jgi:flagellar hook-length control protein FliK
VSQTQSTGVDASKTSTAQTPAPAQLVAPQAQALVQQQLEALATQNFSWQGQIWPGQEMRWEIDEDAARREQDSSETAAKWTTRLRMTLPNLGEIDARIRLQGSQISLAMSADNAETRALMRASSLALRSQLDEAGITLTSMGVDAVAESKTDGQAGK